MKKNKILLAIIIGELITIALLISAAKSYSILAGFSPLLAITIPSLAITAVFMIINNIIYNTYKNNSRKNMDNERRLVSTIFTETQIFTIFILLQAPAFAIFGKLPVLIALSTFLLGLTLNTKYPLVFSKKSIQKPIQKTPIQLNIDATYTSKNTLQREKYWEIPIETLKPIQKTPLQLNIDAIYASKNTIQIEEPTETLETPNQDDPENNNQVKPNDNSEENKGSGSAEKTGHPSHTTSNKTTNTPISTKEDNEVKPISTKQEKNKPFFKNFKDLLMFILSILTAISTANILVKSLHRILQTNTSNTLRNKYNTTTTETSHKRKKRKKTINTYNPFPPIEQIHCIKQPTPHKELFLHTKHTNNSGHSTCLQPFQNWQILNNPIAKIKVEKSRNGETIKHLEYTTDKTHTLTDEDHAYSTPSSSYITYTLAALFVYSSMAAAQRPRPF